MVSPAHRGERLGLVASSRPKSAPMNTPLTAIEQAIIDAALEFAKLHPIESVEQVVGIFEPVAKLTQSPIFQTIPDRDIGAFQDDRNELVEWLSLPPWRHLRKVLKWDATWDLTSDGELVSTARPRLNGVQACTALAVVLLCNRDHGLDRWPQKCEFPNCPNWVFIWPPRAAPRKPCCPAHDSPPSSLSEDMGCP